MIDTDSTSDSDWSGRALDFGIVLFVLGATTALVMLATDATMTTATAGIGLGSCATIAIERFVGVL